MISKRNPRRWRCPVSVGIWLACAALALYERHVEASELNENCVVSILNRTAALQPDGSYLLPNVPSNMGKVRARATCVEDGVTRSGQSAYFEFNSTSRAVRVPPIVFGAGDPVPTSLRITTPSRTLDAVGATVQLTVSAVFSGETRDVTSAAEGTNYTSSNPAVASVDANGLVTAHASGVVLVTAVNEGTIAVERIQVIAGADSDGDGLPDDWEIARGLDPNDATDALIDFDQDGLSTIDEFVLGVDPFDPDSDDDTLLDGEEVNELGTDPLLFDTDGDRVSDGLEVLAGSDPLDPSSVNLGPILESIAVSPHAFTLVFNTVLGEASRRLRVDATLVDGTVLDATGGPYGTTYASSDLTVASFGAEPGRVFAGQDGTAVVTADNAGFAATSAVTVTTFSPTALSFLSLPGFPNAVALGDDEHAYVASGVAGLVVVDVSDPASPFIAGTLQAGTAYGIDYADGHVFVALSVSLAVIDVSNPASPTLVWRLSVPGTPTDVAVADGVAHVAAGTAGLHLIDVSDPADPELLGSVGIPDFARAVALVDGLALVAGTASGLHVVDVSDPFEEAELLGSIATGTNGRSGAGGVAVRDGRAFVADGRGTSLGGLRAVDFNEPETPVVTGSTSDAFGLTAVVLERELALAADYFFVNAVPIFNIEVSPPVFQAVLDFSGPPSFRDDNGHDLAVRDGLVYMVGARGWDSIADNGIRGSGGLHIGRYVQLQDNEGVAPTVRIVSPADGASALERRRLTIEVAAEDDVKVAEVEIRADGEPLATRHRPPFTAMLTVPEEASTLILEATATDLAGATAAAEPVTLTVVPDDDPTVRLLAPAAGTSVIEGTLVRLAATASDDGELTTVEIAVGDVVQASFDEPPFAFDFRVSLGAGSLEVTARAVDELDQEAIDGPRLVTVLADAPPSAVILEPEDGSPVVAESRQVVVAAAADDLGVESLELVVDGTVTASTIEAPYQFDVIVPAAASELRLAVRATDTVGQITTSPESVVTIIADPGTTATGRVVSAAGGPVAGAAVDCVGVSGSTGADGTFAVADVPTLSPLISCGIAATGPGGAPVVGRTASVAPVPGGVTALGDVVLGSQLLMLGNGDASGFGGGGRLHVFDPVTGETFPWSGHSGGLDALSADGQGGLFSIALDRSVGDAVRAAGHLGDKGFGGDCSFAFADSTLRVLDPATGVIGSEVGGVVDVDTGHLLPVTDLALEPSTGRLFALSDCAIFTVDREDAGAVRFADVPGREQGGGLAFGADGRLYHLANGEPPSLEVYDPEDGLLLESVSLGSSDPQATAMALQPGSGRFLVTSADELFELDPIAGTLSPSIGPEGISGDLTSLVFVLPVDPPVETTVVGVVRDFDGDPVEGTVVRYLEASTFTAADGSFTLPAVTAPFSRLVVSAEIDSEVSFSAPAEVVSGGVTDVGVIEPRF